LPTKEKIAPLPYLRRSETKSAHFGVERPARTLITILLLASFTCNISIASSINYDPSGLKINLDEAVEDAIDGGISLTFETQFAHVDRFLFFIWPDQIKSHRFIITRHALSNRYLVHHEDRLAPEIFSSKRESMNFIAAQSMALFLSYHAQDQHNHELHEMRVRLSKTELPGPLRLSAFITKEWDLDSGWMTWKSAQ